MEFRPKSCWLCVKTIKKNQQKFVWKICEKMSKNLWKTTIVIGQPGRCNSLQKAICSMNKQSSKCMCVRQSKKNIWKHKWISRKFLRMTIFVPIRIRFCYNLFTDTRQITGTGTFQKYPTVLRYGIFGSKPIRYYGIYRPV